jgi:hypothetical protein
MWFTQNILPYRTDIMARGTEDWVYRARGISDVVADKQASNQRRRSTMQELLIILQSGFEEDNVTVYVNGKQARRDTDLSTNPLLGIAEEVAIELPARGATIGVEVTSRGLAGGVKLSGRPKSLLVSIEDGKLVIQEGTGREAFL